MKTVDRIKGWVMVVALVGAGFGCHRESPVATVAQSPSKKAAGVSLDAEPAAAPAPPPVVPAESAAPPAGGDEPSGEVSIEKLNAALKQYIVISPNLPDDLAELYRAKLIPKIPVPPPGKQYVVDKKKAQVSLVNQ